MTESKERIMKSMSFILALLISSMSYALECKTGADNGIVCDELGLVCTTISDNGVVCNDASVSCNTGRDNVLVCTRDEKNVSLNYQRLFRNSEFLFNELHKADRR